MKPILKAAAVLGCIAIALAASVFIWITSRGISAREQPGRIETRIARTMRHLAIPHGARELKNPVARTPDVVTEGMEHYADHCATCHANDGSGDTEMGRG